jgi:hypothetical protein
MGHLIATDFSPRYFTPAIKPRLKPTMGGRITPYGVSRARIKPRILPTPIKAVTGRVKASKPSGSIAAPKISSLATATHRGVTSTMKQQSAPAAPPRQPSSNPNPNRISSNPRPAGYRAPASMSSQRPGQSNPALKLPKIHAPSAPKMPKLSLKPPKAPKSLGLADDFALAPIRAMS